MTRSVDEWIGRTDDAMPPPRVRARIFSAHGGRCHISGRLIRAGDKWHLDHLVALILGGENRESNMAPALTEPHKIKTAGEMKIKAKIARVRNKHLGIYKPRNITRWRKFDGSIVTEEKAR